MPLYSFKCITCNANLEYFLPSNIEPKFGKELKLGCSVCGAKGIKRIFTSVPLIKIGNSVQRQRKTFDGFGWHDGLLMNFKGPKDYREYLKKEGLTEYGNEGPPQVKDPEPPQITDDIIKGYYDAGVKVSSREAEALKSGEYQKSAEFQRDLKKLGEKHDT